MERKPVEIRVNLFDMSPTNSVTRGTQLCVYHTSVVIGEQIELYYGFKAHGICGIDTANKIDELPQSMKGKFYTTYKLGKTKRSMDYCLIVIDRMKQDPQWLSDRYNVACHNCHDFAWALCEALLGKGNLHKFPQCVFDCDKLSKRVYHRIVKHLVSDENPPYFLGKQDENSEQSLNTMQAKTFSKKLVLY